MARAWTVCLLLMLCLGQLCALSAFSGWTPPVGYVPMRLKESIQRPPYRPWRVAKAREVLSNSTVVAVASVMQDTQAENKRLRQEVCTQRQEIANLRTHMSALELEAELRDFWHKEFKEVRYVGNDTFVVAYTLRL
jgi:hypothetical protein